MDHLGTRLLILAITAMAGTVSASQKNEEQILVIVFMAARNDLYPYAGRNIKQLQTNKSSDHVKVFVRLDSKKSGKIAKTRQFFVEHNTLKPVGPQDYRDSGSEDSLVETIQRAYTAFPADKVVLIIWNHGTGGIEPAVLKAINPSDLFHFNAKKNRIELERSIGFIDYITRGSPYANETKGIGFDDSSGNYLTIKKLTRAVRRATTCILKKKISILACDACMMAGIDVISGFQDTVSYFVGSQEVILGTGYNYDLLLEPLFSKKMACNALFASHCVAAFEKTYGTVTEDYTHSAIDVSYAHQLERNIDTVAQTLITGLEFQQDGSVKAALRKSRHKTVCTCFKEPTYIDVDNFYENLIQSLDNCSLTTADATLCFKSRLLSLLIEGREIMQLMIKANAVGARLQRARGLSIYFPEYIIHKSYFTNTFAAKKTHWLEFLKKYSAT